jgi:predicted PurR-regulated permease PerM
VPLMVMLGLGLGFNFQPVILAVQNAVNPRQIGVATSSVTSFRQLGGTLGTAAFLSILFNTIPGNISDAVRAAVRANPALADQFQKVASKGSQLNDTSFIQKLPSQLAEPFKVGFATSLDSVFLIAGCVVALAFFVLIFLPGLPLRTTSGLQSQRADDAREGQADPVETPPAG